MLYFFTDIFVLTAYSGTHLRNFFQRWMPYQAIPVKYLASHDLMLLTSLFNGFSVRMGFIYKDIGGEMKK